MAPYGIHNRKELNKHNTRFINQGIILMLTQTESNHQADREDFDSDTKAGQARILEQD